MSEEITGRVVALTSDEYAKFVVVEEPGDHPRKVSCRFYNKRHEQIASVKVGDMVKIAGRSESRESKAGDRWWTNFESWKCERLGNAAALEREPGADDDEAV